MEEDSAIIRDEIKRKQEIKFGKLIKEIKKGVINFGSKAVSIKVNEISRVLGSGVHFERIYALKKRNEKGELEEVYVKELICYDLDEYDKGNTQEQIIRDGMKTLAFLLNNTPLKSDSRYRVKAHNNIAIIHLEKKKKRNLEERL